MRGHFLRAASKTLFPIIAGQVGSGSGGSVTTFDAATVPSQSGDLLLLFVFKANNAGTISTPGGYTSVFQDTVTGLRGALFRKTAGGSEPGTVTVTYTGDASARLIRCAFFVIRNNTGTPASLTATHVSTASPQPPNLTTGFGAVPTLFIAVSFDQAAAGSLTGIPSGYTTGISVSNLSTAYIDKTAASEQPGAFSYDASKNFVTATVGIRGVL